jgi:two-component system NtrC family response regulator
MARILIIDDDQYICEILSRFVQTEGHEASFALTLKAGMENVLREEVDLVFLDVRLPDGSGLDLVPKIREISSTPEIIIITGEGSEKGAQTAMESGCWDYVEKPLSIEAIRLPFLRAIQYRKEKSASKRPVALKREGIVGESRTLVASLNLVAKAGETDANVLILGETGTGKELMARAIHENSLRADNPFVVVDCAALPETLVESTLLGHAKGAFTGADRSRIGLIKEADGGTLFLDEVGDLPLTVQPAFLRVLQEHSFRPVGESKEVRSDFRLVAATNRNLEQMVEAGMFRSDLLFRIKSLVIPIPPLRERTADILELTLFFLKRFSKRYRCGIKGLSPEFCEALQAYSWPGNVRELAQTIERVISIAHDEPTLYPIHLPPEIRSTLKIASMAPKVPETGAEEKNRTYPAVLPKLKDLIETTEKKYFEDLLSLTGGNLPEVCRRSGLSRANVYVRLKKYGLVLRS